MGGTIASKRISYFKNVHIHYLRREYHILKKNKSLKKAIDNHISGICMLVQREYHILKSDSLNCPTFIPFWNAPTNIYWLVFTTLMVASLKWASYSPGVCCFVPVIHWIIRWWIFGMFVSQKLLAFGTCLDTYYGAPR